MLRHKRQWMMYLLVFFGTGLFVLVWLRPHQRDLFTAGFWRNIIHVGQVMLLVNHDYVEPDKADYDALTSGSASALVLAAADNFRECALMIVAAGGKCYRE